MARYLSSVVTSGAESEGGAVAVALLMAVHVVARRAGRAGKTCQQQYDGYAEGCLFHRLSFLFALINDSFAFLLRLIISAK